MRFPESSLKTLNRWTSSSACIWTVQMLCIIQNQEPELGEDSQNPRYRPVQKTATSDQSPEGICSVCEQIVLKSDYTSQQSHLMNASSECVGKWTLEIMVSKSITLPKQTTSNTQAHFPCWFLSSDKNQGFSQLAGVFLLPLQKLTTISTDLKAVMAIQCWMKETKWQMETHQVTELYKLMLQLVSKQ